MEEIMIHLTLIYKKNLPHPKGFTLVELMVVIAIISILTSFVAPQLTRQIAKANLIAVHTVANQNQAAIEEYIMTYSEFPDENDFSTWLVKSSSDDTINTIAINSNSNTTGTLKITLNALTGLDAGNYFLFSRDKNATWDCTASLTNDYLPEHCTSLVTNGEEEE